MKKIAKPLPKKTKAKKSRPKKPPLPAEVKELLAKPDKIMYIKSRKNNVDFFLNDNSRKSHRITFWEVIAWLKKSIFLQTHVSYVINMHYVYDYVSSKEKCEVILSRSLINPDESTYIPVSDSFREKFQEKIPYMFVSQYKRSKKEVKRHKWLFSSKYSIYFCIAIYHLDYVAEVLVLI